jgi:predicted ester cyclase
VELQVAEGDKVVTRFISQGTQTGAFLGHLPTGHHARWTGIAIDRIVGGKIVESWVNWDMMSMLWQLGLVAYPK